MLHDVFAHGKPRHEIPALTGIRGVAAVYVVFYHYLNPPFSSVPFVLLGHGYLAVDLFFVLSGFVMALANVQLFAGGISGASLCTFAVRRVARVFPLYWSLLLVATPLALYGILPIAPNFGWRDVVANGLLVQNWFSVDSTIGPAWSISAEMLSYCLFPFLLMALFRRRTFPMFVLAGVACATAAMLHMWALHQGLWPKASDIYWGAPSLLRCATEFTLGMCAYRFSLTERGKAMLQGSWLLYPLIAALIVLLALPGTDLWVAYLFVPFVFWLSGKPTRISQWMGLPAIEKLGQLSFSIYLLHRILQPLIRTIHLFMNRAGLQHGQTIGIVLTLLILFLLSVLTFSAIEVPGRRFLRDRMSAALRG